MCDTILRGKIVCDTILRGDILVENVFYDCNNSTLGGVYFGGRVCVWHNSERQPLGRNFQYFLHFFDHF